MFSWAQAIKLGESDSNYVYKQLFDTIYMCMMILFTGYRSLLYEGIC